MLGYHGYYSSLNEVRIENETLGEARLVNALIFEYATRMGNVDIGLLSLLLSTPPAEIETIDTPREIEGLGIKLSWEDLKPPKGWAQTACRAEVTDTLGHLNWIGVDDRLVGDPAPMPSLSAFRSRLLEDKYPEEDAHDAIRDAVLSVPPSDGLDLLAGQPLYADGPKVGAWRQKLERGAGFYYDVCYAMTDFKTIRTLVVDSMGTSVVTTASGALRGFPPDQTLW